MLYKHPLFLIFVLGLITACTKPDQTNDYPTNNVTELDGEWSMYNRTYLKTDSVVLTIDSCLQNTALLLNNNGLGIHLVSANLDTPCMLNAYNIKLTNINTTHKSMVNLSNSNMTYTTFNIIGTYDQYGTSLGVGYYYGTDSLNEVYDLYRKEL